MNTETATKETFNNNVGNMNGALLLTRFYRECKSKNTPVDSRNYHIGLKSLFNDNSRDTVFLNDILILAEGISPRMLMMR